MSHNDPTNDTLQKFIFAISSILSGGILLVGLKELVVPPFSDQEILDSLVDTWEASALGSLIVCIFLLISAVVIWLAVRTTSNSAVRRWGRIVLATTLAAIVLLVTNHYILTSRVNRIGAGPVQLF